MYCNADALISVCKFTIITHVNDIEATNDLLVASILLTCVVIIWCTICTPNNKIVHPIFEKCALNL